MFGKSRASSKPTSAADTPTCSMNSPFSQRILGIWRVGTHIAHGEGTELYLAQPAETADSPRWDYVLKTVQTPTSGVPSAGPTRRISQTIASAGIKHPNLIAILDESDSGTAPYVVMPRLDAVNLTERIDGIAQFALPVALWWTRQLAQAAEALHQNGWIHGDIQPANVLVDSQGHATLIDMGNAARIHSPLQPLFRGTPAYAAPELAGGNTAAIPAMDVFSLGRVLWETLALTQPTASSLMESVAELIEGMVAAEPSERPSSSEVVHRLLQLEIETLGCHIVPERTSTRRAA
ncbi:protein kinase family protein [Rhodopirellula sp. JC740]|uniref:Protein kinase family protein n=1 Tax=Rhodopirellula halodulae TaxID=2894198 RepID=A0ABS8NF95_9BACT|nr:protein kinase family protein [Rhodopirellula sp. JC740]MCC9642224.1 protein kinase family protein [Rhodopirellula sp. JC740]